MLAVVWLFAACDALGPPPMEPLTRETLKAAEGRWETHGAESYHLVVRVRAPRLETALYDVRVSGGTIVAVGRNDREIERPDLEDYDYSVPGLFDLLREDLRLDAVSHAGSVRPIDLRARFDATTGRLVRYRRTVGTFRRRVLMVEVLTYEPEEGAASPVRARRDGIRPVRVRDEPGRPGHPSS